MAGELAALGRELGDQLSGPPDVIFHAQRGIIMLVLRERVRLGGAQRRVVLIGVAVAQLGVGGYRELPLLAGCLFRL